MEVFILKVLKVLCFDTLLQVFILKADSGTAGALAQFLFAAVILLQAVFLGNVGKKGVSRAGGYFIGYYTIWLAPVKRYFVPFWELETRRAAGQNPKRRITLRAAIANATPVNTAMIVTLLRRSC
jgi:hypothetical protein